MGTEQLSYTAFDDVDFELEPLMARGGGEDIETERCGGSCSRCTAVN